ncbi:ion transporter [Reichenbachiella sp. MALMAid0571]|uniref:ion transporter n=1 Tax=Reichenbachiella sp. MALMAid0571 TaxID=3143939 RepID=UPI0032DEBE60
MSIKEHLKVAVHFEPLKQKIYRIIFGIDTVAGRLFDLVLLCIILLSVILIMLESVVEISLHFGKELRIAEWILTILFTIEYIARIISTPKPLKYIFSFMGIVDLLSLFPTYVGLFFDGTHSLAIIRSIRLIRVFRILKLTHFMGGANQLGNALYDSRHKIIVFLGTILCTVSILGTLMYLIEGSEHGFTSIPRSIYWAIVTITTVGYGDIAPETWFGQLVASMLMIIGYAIIAVPTGIVTSEMIKANNDEIRPKGICPECNADGLDRNDKYCHNCGTEL